MSPTEAAQRPVVLLRLAQVRARTGRSTSYIYKGIREGWFPKPVKDGTASLWVETEIDAYNLALIAKRDMGQNMGKDKAA